jgi:signal transduction histidine kinase
MLVLTDNGRGLEEKRRLGVEEVVMPYVGPVSIRERVRDLGGSLVLASGPEGLELNISLPLNRFAAERSDAAPAC